MESFSDVFEALPIEAKRFFLEKLLGDAIAENTSLNKAIDKLDPNNLIHRKQAADAMRQIVEKFLPVNEPPAKLRENTEDLASIR